MEQIIKKVIREFASEKLKNLFNQLIKKGRVNTVIDYVGGDVVSLLRIMGYRESDLDFIVKNFGLSHAIKYFGGPEAFAKKFYGNTSDILKMMMTDSKMVSDFFGGAKNLLKVLKIPQKRVFISKDLILSVDGAPFTLFNSKTSKYVLTTPTHNFGEWTGLYDYFWENGVKEKWELTNLSNLKNTKGNLYLSDVHLTNFGGLEKHGGNLVLAHNSSILNWDTLKNIKGNLTIYETAKVNSLGYLQSVGGKVEIKGDVKDLGELKRVGKDLIISNQTLETLGKIEKVGGRLRIRNSKIEDLGDLKEVGDRVLINKNTNPNVIKQCLERNFVITKV